MAFSSFPSGMPSLCISLVVLSIVAAVSLIVYHSVTAKATPINRDPQPQTAPRSFAAGSSSTSTTTTLFLKQHDPLATASETSGLVNKFSSLAISSPTIASSSQIDKDPSLHYMHVDPKVEFE